MVLDPAVWARLALSGDQIGWAMLTLSWATTDSLPSARVRITRSLLCAAPSSPPLERTNANRFASGEKANSDSCPLLVQAGFAEPPPLAPIAACQRWPSSGKYIEQAFWAGDPQTAYIPHDGHLWQPATG